MRIILIAVAMWAETAYAGEKVLYDKRGERVGTITQLPPPVPLPRPRLVVPEPEIIVETKAKGDREVPLPRPRPISGEKE